MESHFSTTAQALHKSQTQTQFCPFRTGRESRRTPRKAPYSHTPYRGDSPEVGKKTGMAIRLVERDEDGFEPFEEVLKQADYHCDGWATQYRRTWRSSPVTSGGSEGDYVMVEDNERVELDGEEEEVDNASFEPEDVFSTVTPLTPSRKFHLMSSSLVADAGPPPHVPQSVESAVASGVEVTMTATA